MRVFLNSFSVARVMPLTSDASPWSSVTDRAWRPARGVLNDELMMKKTRRRAHVKPAREASFLDDDAVVSASLPFDGVPATPSPSLRLLWSALNRSGGPEGLTAAVYAIGIRAQSPTRIFFSHFNTRFLSPGTCQVAHTYNHVRYGGQNGGLAIFRVTGVAP